MKINLSRRISAIVLAVFFSCSLYAQVNSPYSRIGLGNIFPSQFAAAQGSGFLSAAYTSGFNINYANPASYASLPFATFEVGGYGNVLTLKDGADKFTSGNGNLAYLSLAFPMLIHHKSRFGLSLGVIPYSGFQYDIEQDTESPDTLLGTQTYEYIGDGTLYQLYAGLGWRYAFDSSAALSLGVNTGDVFGTLSNTTIASFPDQLNAINTKLLREDRVNGFIWNYGAAFEKGFTKKIDEKTYHYKVFTLGAAGNIKQTITGKESVGWFNTVQVGNVESITDTLYLAPDTSGNFTLPSSFRIGLTFKNYFIESYSQNRYMVGIEYDRTNWSEYTGIQDAPSLVNSSYFRIGAEFTQKIETGKKRPFTYRLGTYFGNSNLEMNGQQLKDAGLTLGIGIPIGLGKQATPFERNSKINVSLNIGQRGASDAIKETYFNATFGFNLNDIGWFVKPKIK